MVNWLTDIIPNLIARLVLVICGSAYRRAYTRDHICLYHFMYQWQLPFQPYTLPSSNALPLIWAAFRQPVLKTAATVFLLSIVYCGDCQQTLSCLPTVFSLILIRTKPNKPDRQTCHKWKCWSFHLWSPDSRNPPSRIAWSQSDVDEVAKEVINDLDKVKDVLEDKNNFVIEQKKRSGQREKKCRFP